MSMVNWLQKTLDAMDRRRGQVEINYENSARLAHAYGTVETTGLGTVEIEDRINFATAFVEKPFVQDSHVVDMDALAEELGIAPGGDVPLPHCTGYVTEWDQDERDFYLGAWVAIKVSFDTQDLVPLGLVEITSQPVIEHHFTFSAIALKDIPVDVTDPSTD